MLCSDISNDDKYIVTGSGDKKATLYEVIFWTLASWRGICILILPSTSTEPIYERLTEIADAMWCTCHVVTLIALHCIVHSTTIATSLAEGCDLMEVIVKLWLLSFLSSQNSFLLVQKTFILLAWVLFTAWGEVFWLWASMRVIILYIYIGWCDRVQVSFVYTSLFTKKVRTHTKLYTNIIHVHDKKHHNQKTDSIGYQNV